MSTGTLDTAPPGPPLDWDQDEDLIWVKTEVERSTAIERDSAPIDWAGIRARSSRFLELTSDWILLVARARAAVHADGMSELAPALETLTTAASASWTTMQPALPRGLARRANYLTWFIEGLSEAVSGGRVDGTTHDALKAAIERLAALDEVLRPLMGGSYPGVRLLRESLNATLAKAAPAVTAPAPASQSASSSVAAVAPAAVQEFPPPIDNEDTADRVLSKTKAALIAVADARQAASVGDALAYRLRRMAVWLRQTTELALDENGRLLVQGPSADEQERVRGALDTDAKGVVAAAEQLLEQYPLWLDANYLTFLALSRSGASCRAAADLVVVETLALVQRLPSLPELEFSDEVPVASPDTRDWLATESAKRGGVAPAAASSPVPAAAIQDELAAAERAAGELAAQGQLDESFKVLDDGMREAGSGRERFRWRLAAGRHAARTGRVDLAVNVFSGLDQEAKELRLDVWEPDLWAAVLTSMLELGRKGRRDRVAPEVLALLPEVEQRLSRLDLMAAVRLSKERG
jgi:type VI secretion system protein VasJ